MDDLDSIYQGHIPSVYRYACYNFLATHLNLTDRTECPTTLVKAIVSRYPNPIGLSVKGYSPHHFA